MQETLSLQPQTREMIRLRLQGWKVKEIAAALDLQESTVSTTLSSTLAKRQMEELQGIRDREVMDTMEELNKMLPRALEIYEEIVNRRVEVTPMQRVRVAGDILDRTGYGKVTKVEGRHVHAHGKLTQEYLDDIKKKAIERRIRADEASQRRERAIEVDGLEG